MDTLSIIFGIGVGLVGGMCIGFEMFREDLRKERASTIRIKTDTQLVMFVPSKDMEDCQFVGIERMRTKEK